MAELDTSSGGGKKKGGKKRGKKLSTRVDLTPMVDLGFLLITFFIFTTTMAKPKTMEIVMPVDDEEITDSNKVKDYTAMTIMLSKENRVYYYYGIGDDPFNPPKVKVTTFSPTGGVRDAILQLKKSVDSMKQIGVDRIAGVTEDDEATILIKPDTTSTYADMVNALDEMQINGINVYALVDITDVERDFIKKTENANNE